MIQGRAASGEFAPFLEYDDVTLRALARQHYRGVVRIVARTSALAHPHVNAIVPAADPHTAARIAYRAFVGDGCRTVKVKVAERVRRWMTTSNE